MYQWLDTNAYSPFLPLLFVQSGDTLLSRTLIYLIAIYHYPGFYLLPVFFFFSLLLVHCSASSFIVAQLIQKLPDGVCSFGTNTSSKTWNEITLLSAQRHGRHIVARPAV